MDPSNSETSFKNTGAVEQDRPEQETNVAPMQEQLDHRFQDPLNKTQDSGLPGQGQTPEFTGETEVNNELEKDTRGCQPKAEKQELRREMNAMNKMDRPKSNDTDQNAQNFDTRSKDESRQSDATRRDPDGNNPEDETVDQDPGESQKRNQGEKKDDDLAA
jgi:hypothetical protein